MAMHNDEHHVQKIIAETLRRRESGEELTDEDVLAAHPDFIDELREKLRQLQVVANARELAANSAIEETIFHAHNDSTISHRADRKPVPGQQIRHYVLETQIGLGGFGSVWRARDTKLDCDVAIKIPARGSLTAGDIDRFIHEARMSAQLRQHPNIVSVHEADWDDQTAFIVCDLIDGESLGDRIDRSRIPSAETVDLIIQICGALHHAHDAGVIHRDLKPDNILLDAAGNPHVTDFGLARREDQSMLRESAQTLGTAPYMSPEQAGGNSDRADRRSDVFSVGVILYELLTGERPFRGSVLRILQQICEEDPPSPRSLDSSIPLDLETICLKCIEKDPDSRYQSAAELAEELGRYQRHEPILAHPVSAIGRLWRWSKRNPSIPWLSLALFMVALASTVIGAYLLNREVESMQARVEEYSHQFLELTAAVAVDDAKEKLHDRFEQVKQLSEDKALRESLVAWRKLGPADRSRLRDELRVDYSPPALEMLQGLVETAGGLSRGSEKTADRSGNAKTFSWFVCDAEGYQVARYPPKETLGEPFHWRSYHADHAKDQPTSSEPGVQVSPQQEVEPKLSACFTTVDGDARVLAISSPIRDEGAFYGVVGIFIELRNLVSIPGMSESQERFMSIYDARQGKEKALPIRHLFYVQLYEKGTRLDAVDPKPTDLRPLLNRADEFKDPFFELGTWRAIAKPIQARQLSGLYVVVQERRELAVGPGEELGANLAFLGLSVLGLAAAVLFPVWVIILRRVVR